MSSEKNENTKNVKSGKTASWLELPAAVSQEKKEPVREVPESG